jgi:3D (Asp-Asp-Asp) domain-containing protein
MNARTIEKIENTIVSMIIVLCCLGAGAMGWIIWTGIKQQREFEARPRIESYEIKEYEPLPVFPVPDKQMPMIITAYCACVKCCGRWADGITASGTKPVEGSTAAMNGVPFGSVVEIEGVGWRVIEDRMAARYSDRIDIYFDRHKDALQFGIRTNTVRFFEQYMEIQQP